jgi:hypothetical protein
MVPNTLTNKTITSAIETDGFIPFFSNSLTAGSRIKESNKPADKGIKILLPK